MKARLVSSVFVVWLFLKVPDRGGRPSSTAPPVEMPAFKKRTEAPRDQRQSSNDKFFLHLKFYKLLI